MMLKMIFKEYLVEKNKICKNSVEMQEENVANRSSSE